MKRSSIALLSGIVLCGLAATSSFATELPSNAAMQLPESEMPAEGWPSIVLLHGYGMNKEDFSDFAALCASLGVAAIAVDAPTSLGGNRRSWPERGDETYAAVEPVLDFIDRDPRFNALRVLVGGFSQGGYQSLILGNHYPEKFIGILSMAPGGGAKVPTMWSGNRFRQGLYMMVGTSDSKSIRNLVDDAAGEWEEAGMRVRVYEHPGGHELPEDLTEQLTKALDFLLMRAGDGC